MYSLALQIGYSCSGLYIKVLLWLADRLSGLKQILSSLGPLNILPKMWIIVVNDAGIGMLWRANTLELVGIEYLADVYNLLLLSSFHLFRWKVLNVNYYILYYIKLAKTLYGSIWHHVQIYCVNGTFMLENELVWSYSSNLYNNQLWEIWGMLFHNTCLTEWIK